MKRIQKMYKKTAVVVSMVLVFLALPIAPIPKVSAANVTESESNNTALTADLTADDNNNYGTISSGTDEDWWKVTFSTGGMVTFWLGDIPSNCDYDMELYIGDEAFSCIAYSERGVGLHEQIKANVKAGVTYYIRVYTVSGTSSSQYLLRAKRYDYRTVRIFTSTSSSPGNDNTPTADYSLPYLWSVGFDAGEYLHNNASVVYSSIPSSDITVLRGHGYEYGGIYFLYDSNGNQSSLYANNSSSTVALSNYTSSQLSQVKLIMFVACSTGITNSTYGNLVDVARNKGAFAAVGWKETIYTTSTNEWVGKFFQYSSNGINAENAMNRADLYIEQNRPGYADCLANRYVGTSRMEALNLGYNY